METENSALGVDFKNLMSCIHCHEDSQDNNVIIETLQTIIDICSNESCGQDAFREEGGLDFLVEFLFVTDNTLFLDHTLTTLAFVIDGNVHSQMYMSKTSVFEVLQAILKNPSFPTSVQKNTLVLISTILYQNSIAQSLIFEIGLLQDLLNMYEQYTQSFMINSSMILNSDITVHNLWMSTNSALCFAVNNPQNEKNQDLCKCIFPVCLKILEYSSNSAIKNSVASFLALTISDNGNCKDSFSSYDGLLVLKRCFQKYFDSLLMDMKICNGIIGKENCQAIHNIVGIISSASFDHEKNAAISGDLGILSMMVKLLFMETIDYHLKTKIVLSLGHCIAACCSNQSYVLETENFDTFLKESLQLKNKELSSACKYLLQVCLVYKGSPESNLFFLEDSYFADISEKSNPEYSNDFLKDNGAFDGTVVENPCLKQNFVKMPRIRSPSLKINSRFWKKVNSASSSSHESNAFPARREKCTKVSKHLNKLSTIKKDLPKLKKIARPIKKFSFSKKSPSISSSVQCNILSYQPSSSRDEKFPTNIHSNTNLVSSKHKYSEKEMINASFNEKFSKQDISKNMPFTDFLKDEPTGTNPELKNQKFFETSYSKILSDSLISELHTYNNKNILQKNNKTAELSTNISPKIESIFQGKIKSSLSSHVKVENSASELETSLRFLKRKTEGKSPKQPPKAYSSSSSEYTFAPYIPKKRIDENNSDCLQRQNIDIPNQKEMNFSKMSPQSTSEKINNDQNSFMKLNTDTKLQLPVKKHFSLKAESQKMKDDHTEFSLKFTPMTFENSSGIDSSLASYQRIPKVDKENTLDFTNFADSSSLRLGKRLGNSDFSSNFVKPFSRKTDICSKDCYQSVNCRVLPQTSKFSGNLFKMNDSWSCSTTSSGKESFSPFCSSLNSDNHVQVIVLPNGTCKRHGLSTSVEMLEVISLEDIMS